MALLKNKIDVSIVIVNYRSWRHLRACLSSLRNLDRVSFTFETIVVDNCSNDENFNKFSNEFLEVSFFLNTGNNGFANGCNFGASKAIGDSFLFLNPDTIVNALALEKIFHFSKLNSNIGITSCLQKKPSGGYEKYVRSFPRITNLFGISRAIIKIFKKRVSIKENQILYTDWVSGSFVFISRHWFIKIDGWNENYWMYYEDVDLCKKIEQVKAKVAVLTSVEIIHNHGGASRLNIKTSSITKTEVQISKHIYIQNHFRGIERILSHFLLIINNVLFKMIVAVLGLFLFFIPKMRLNVYLLFKMINYYLSSFIRRSWLSSNSINLLKTND